jgi:hypothetical protein
MAGGRMPIAGALVEAIRSREVAPIFDCDSCGGPMPLGVRCPHCAATVGRSLRAIALHFALLGAAGCCASSVSSESTATIGSGSSSGGIMTFADAYGLPFFDAGCRAGDVCACTGTQLCVCSATGDCVPYTPDGG